MISVRTLALVGGLFLGACCPAALTPSNVCAHATQAATCARINGAIQTKCGGATPPMSCSTLFHAPCTSFPNICTSDTNNCVARITATFTCAQALAVQCAFTCVD